MVNSVNTNEYRQIRKNAWEYPHLGGESPITARLLNAKNYKS